MVYCCLQRGIEQLDNQGKKRGQNQHHFDADGNIQKKCDANQRRMQEQQLTHGGLLACGEQTVARISRSLDDALQAAGSVVLGHEISLIDAGSGMA